MIKIEIGRQARAPVGSVVDFKDDDFTLVVGSLA